MILGTKGRYAVMAMVDLAGRPAKQPVCLSEIAEAQEIPQAYLEQIFNKLKRGGLVQSVRGPGGGYMLAKPMEETWVADIIMAVDESLRMTRCSGKTEDGCMASRSQCLTHELWEGLGNHIYAYLKGISLKDVCERKIAPLSLSAKFAEGLLH